MKTQNRIGYKHFDKVSNRVKKEKVAEDTNRITPAQASVIETIETLTAVIVSDLFASFSIVQKISYLEQLKEYVSINAEVNVKNVMLSNM